MLGATDRRLLRVMRTWAHGRRAERGMQALGAAGEWGAIWAGAALAASALDRGRRERWLTAAAVGPLAVGANYAVKLLVRRRRPTLDGLPALAGAPSELSFPSAHATSSFAAATAMARIAPGARAPLYGLAALISLTRPYLGMHYPSDVLAGAALGTVLGLAWPELGRDRASSAFAGDRP